MTKLCSVCGTENREEAQFCRACGTAFPPPAPAFEAKRSTRRQHLRRVRLPEQAGHPLLRQLRRQPARHGDRAARPCRRHAARSARRHQPAADQLPVLRAGRAVPPAPVGTSAYPPVAGASYAAPAAYPPAYDDPLGPTEISDPTAALAAMRQHRVANEDASASAPAAAVPAFAAPAPNRAPLIIGVVVALLVAVGAAAWWFMRGSGAPAPAAAASAAPMAAPAPAAVEPAASTVAASAASAAEAAAAPPPEPAASPVETATPAAPPVVEPAAPSASDIEAQRIAAEKKREREAKAKADREAKAKALAEQQQQQAAAAQRAAEQEAARRRAEEAARSARAAPPPPVAPAPVQTRGVQQICAGRGMIAESMCQSLECGKTEHANEPLCKQIKEKEDRRRGS